MRRGTPSLDDEVEESIELAHDEDEGTPSNLVTTRHTRSHYDLHNRKSGGISARHASRDVHGHTATRVPLQPRVSTPPCPPGSFLGGSGGVAGASGAGRHSCGSCLSLTSSATPACAKDHFMEHNIFKIQ